MINNVVLTGRLTRDAELKYTGTGTAVASFTLAVDRAFKSANGEKETDFINVVAWRKTAETLATYTKKGSLIGVQGRIQTRNYENSEGKRIYVTEVVADSFTFLESKKQADSNGSGNQSTSYQGNNQSRTQVQNDPFLSSGQEVSIDEFEMPF